MTSSRVPVFPGALINNRLQPGVEATRHIQNRFSGFFKSHKIVETVPWNGACEDTGLNPGVNRTVFEGGR
jgi:hypothetical protein